MKLIEKTRQEGDEIAHAQPSCSRSLFHRLIDAFDRSTFGDRALGKRGYSPMSDKTRNDYVGNTARAAECRA